MSSIIKLIGIILLIIAGHKIASAVIIDPSIVFDVLFYIIAGFALVLHDHDWD